MKTAAGKGLFLFAHNGRYHGYVPCNRVTRQRENCTAQRTFPRLIEEFRDWSAHALIRELDEFRHITARTKVSALLRGVPRQFSTCCTYTEQTPSHSC